MVAEMLVGGSTGMASQAVTNAIRSILDARSVGIWAAVCA